MGQMVEAAVTEMPHHLPSMPDCPHLMKCVYLKLIIAAACLLWAIHSVYAQAAPPSATGKATAEIADAAQTFLATLDETLRRKVVLDFEDEAQRKRWSNFPTVVVKRGGLRVGDLTKAQREAAMKLLAASLSPQGYEKVLQIVESDEVLRMAEDNDIFGRDEYYISLLGEPSATQPWMIQFGGHHLGLNITLLGGQGTSRRASPERSRRFMSSKARQCARSVARRTRHSLC